LIAIYLKKLTVLHPHQRIWALKLNPSELHHNIAGLKAAIARTQNTLYIDTLHYSAPLFHCTRSIAYRRMLAISAANPATG
jgi:hypothetical protein